MSYAFASAVAPVDRYDPDLVGEALCLLGQDPAAELACVYCDAPATSWDHLVGLVKDGRYSGFGHVLGNLVPCCGACNGRKGNKPWRSFVDSIPDPARRALVTERIERMVMRFFGFGGFWIWLTSEELRVVCYLDTRLKEIVDPGTFNGELFSLLLSEQDEIEAITGADLVWEGLPGRKAYWIGLTRPRPNSRTTPNGRRPEHGCRFHEEGA